MHVDPSAAFDIDDQLIHATLIIKIMAGPTLRHTRVRVVSQVCGIAVPGPQRHTHATHVIYVTLTIKLGPAPLCDTLY